MHPAPAALRAQDVTPDTCVTVCGVSGESGACSLERHCCLRRHDPCAGITLQLNQTAAVPGLFAHRPARPVLCVQPWTRAGTPATGWCATSSIRCLPGTRGARAGAAQSVSRAAQAEVAPCAAAPASHTGATVERSGLPCPAPVLWPAGCLPVRARYAGRCPGGLTALRVLLFCPLPIDLHLCGRACGGGA